MILKCLSLKSVVSQSPPNSFFNISMAAAIFFLVPLSTYNAKDFLNNFTKLPPLPAMFQKAFSMQMSSAICIKIWIRFNEKS